VTTLAYRNGIMAADSTIWEDGCRAYSAKKIRRLSDGSLVGFAGNYDDVGDVIDWLEAGAKGPKPRTDLLDALVVRPNGKVFRLVQVSKRLLPAEGPYFAIGMGMQAALGAMFAGADPRTAVMAARAHTDGAAGRILVMRLV
jgi:ATP-dependent protease HslVU (ClpYQ) peptidase subunit